MQTIFPTSPKYQTSNEDDITSSSSDMYIPKSFLISERPNKKVEYKQNGLLRPSINLEGMIQGVASTSTKYLTSNEDNITPSSYNIYILQSSPVSERENKPKFQPRLLSILSQVNKKVEYKQSGLPKRSPNLEAMIRGVAKLAEVDPDFQDDEHILNPSRYAIAETFALLENLDFLLGQKFPKGYVSLESRGGIYLTWESTEFYKEVWLQISAEPDLDDSVLCSDDDREEEKFIKNPSHSKIAELLDWLCTDQKLSDL